jgi:hypothetical protein
VNEIHVPSARRGKIDEYPKYGYIQCTSQASKLYQPLVFACLTVIQMLAGGTERIAEKKNILSSLDETIDLVSSLAETIDLVSSLAETIVLVSSKDETIILVSSKDETIKFIAKNCAPIEKLGKRPTTPSGSLKR